MRKVHGKCKGAFFPDGALRPWYLTIPLEHVETTIFLILHRFSNKAKRMITPPIFSFFFESIDHQLIDFFFLHESVFEWEKL